MLRDDRIGTDLPRVEPGTGPGPREARGVEEPTGGFTVLDGETYYRIAGHDRMPSFLMSLASDTDLWMFVTSRGGLTAGRMDPDGAVFPYETEDKLAKGHHHTGPITMIRARRAGGSETLWKPFVEPYPADPGIERNLYKNPLGNRLVFEEIRRGLGLAFRYRWAGCDAFGWVRTATLTNLDSSPVEIELLDGFRNLLPFGVPLALYQRASSLVDAYKRIECDRETGLGTVSLTSGIVDRPEAAEVLRANTVWCSGLDGARVALSAEALTAFRRGEAIETEPVLMGRRANYLATASLTLDAGGETSWHLALDAGRDAPEVVALRERLRDGGSLDRAVEGALGDADLKLRRIMGSADGFQLTGHPETEAHHLANVLFNCMRGGVVDGNYTIPTDDLVDFFRIRNRAVADRHPGFPGNGATIPLDALMRAAEATGDADLQRLCYEYLPIWFGRRHGDPSRPWNHFAIRVTDDDGTRALEYQGNWRDIFQNWEALSLSYPGFLPGIIAKFVNASTLDGFNPYRITRDGIDWEVSDPDDPWSFIGYWGDHQIIYLLKFLEAFPRYAPGALDALLNREVFCYADVPYRIAPYDAILRDPHDTISFDGELEERIEERIGAIGSDGRLVHGPDGGILHVNLLEKLLVPILAKVSNLVPEGGIWMNTQRPEWNDANNALVGNGISVVTLCYLRRYLAFLAGQLEARRGESLPVSREVGAWFQEVRSVLETERNGFVEGGSPTDTDRKRLMDALGGAFDTYRSTVYANGLSGKEPLAIDDVIAFCTSALEVIDPSIRSNRRDDGLYHAYNLLQTGPDTATVTRLYEMLEGQVAALSSGLVEPAEATAIIGRMFESALYREDQRSFLLYPDRELPGFLAQNIVPEDRVQSVGLLRDLIGAGERSLVIRDASGVCRFHGDIANAEDVAAVLDELAAEARWKAQVDRDREAVLETFETVFDHHSFTGRSGTMVGYEGLGCIYWHMVAKLLLAVQEVVLRAHENGDPAFEPLAEGYYLVRAGIGYERSAAEYGAFPTDPYSHTPPRSGARQPGMTGQVKEEILTRFGELGVTVEAGTLAFRPALLRALEFRPEAGTLRYVDLTGAERSLEVPVGGLAFTVCQVPVVYTLSEAARIRVVGRDGSEREVEGDRLDAAASRAVFDRVGTIDRIEVEIPQDGVLRL